MTCIYVCCDVYLLILIYRYSNYAYIGSGADKSYNNSLPSASAINYINSDHKNVINLQQNECNDQNIASKLCGYSVKNKKVF